MLVFCHGARRLRCQYKATTYRLFLLDNHRLAMELLLWHCQAPFPSQCHQPSGSCNHAVCHFAVAPPSYSRLCASKQGFQCVNNRGEVEEFRKFLRKETELKESHNEPATPCRPFSFSLAPCHQLSSTKGLYSMEWLKEGTGVMLRRKKKCERVDRIARNRWRPTWAFTESPSSDRSVWPVRHRVSATTSRLWERHFQILPRC